MFLDHAEALVGVEEGVGLGEDPDMLGDGAGHHPEQDQRTGWGIGRGDFRHHRPRSFGHHLARAGSRPNPGCRAGSETARPHHLAPDTARETKAIAADPAQTGLVVIGRAQPGPRDGDDASRIGGLHSTALRSTVLWWRSAGLRLALGYVESPEVGDIGELCPAGRKALVATRPDHEGVRRHDRPHRRFQQGEDRHAIDEVVR